MFRLVLEHGTARASQRRAKGETMDRTDRLYDLLGEHAAAVTIWQARGDGFVPAEIRGQGVAALKAMEAFAAEALAGCQDLTRELADAGHVPLVSAGEIADGLSAPVALGKDARIQPGNTARMAGH
jgi:hypothetical protein